MKTNGSITLSQNQKLTKIMAFLLEKCYFVIYQSINIKLILKLGVGKRLGDSGL